MNLYKQKREYFPDPRFTMFDDVIDINDDLSCDRLFEAYSFGIFPWPHEEYPVLWFSPEKRGVLHFDEVHFSKSFLKWLKKNEWTVSFNQNFEQVMLECGQAFRSDNEGTWITPQLHKAYLDFHKAGHAHSVECWKGNQLIGGAYGVMVGGVFSAESMFFKESNASKLALYYLIEKLKKLGLTWLDIQMVTPFTESIGGKYIDRELFFEWLDESHKKNIFWK